MSARIQALEDDRQISAQQAPTESRFTRSKDGKTVHRADCKVPGDRLPWRWADDKTDHKVAWTILQTPWLRPCKKCMGGLADAL